MMFLQGATVLSNPGHSCCNDLKHELKKPEVKFCRLSAKVGGTVQWLEY